MQRRISLLEDLQPFGDNPNEDNIDAYLEDDIDSTTSRFLIGLGLEILNVKHRGNVERFKRMYSEDVYYGVTYMQRLAPDVLPVCSTFNECFSAIQELAIHTFPYTPQEDTIYLINLPESKAVLYALLAEYQEQSANNG